MTQQGTPLLTINPSGWPDIPYLSNLEIQCTIRNISDFPPTLETKWQRNKFDFNISDVMYKGSSLDLFNPKLVINRIDFDRDDDVRYQCMARNSEGWGSSLSEIRIDVKGSMSFNIYQSTIFHYICYLWMDYWHAVVSGLGVKFLESCNYSRECLYGASLTCSNKQCLCSSGYFHKNKVCYHSKYIFPYQDTFVLSRTTIDKISNNGYIGWKQIYIKGFKLCSPINE